MFADSNNNEPEQANTSLSSHTISLRRALRDCMDGIERLRRAQDDGFISTLCNDGTRSDLAQRAWAAAKMHRSCRQDGISDVRRRLAAYKQDGIPPIDIIHVDDSSSYHLQGSQERITTYQFKKRYCVRNIPCIIRGMSATDFAYVSSNWRTESNAVNVDWFKEHVGDETNVPVRVDPTDDAESSSHELDADGRAIECESVNVKLCEWIEHCQQLQRPMSPESAYNYNNELGPSGYLKDWHLQQLLATKRHENSTPLYSVPSIFQRDLLNNFLTRYTDGDYKFVYWGPAQSRTNLHSDVLHSFSWSYNVIGKKLWTFYIPNDSSDTQKFQLVQETGETIFVPAMWKHEVTNLVETLSINHNWVTSANLDCTFECLLIEMASIEIEIQEWGVISEDDYEARENMLRGCVGLDVSMLIMMSLLEMVELLEGVFLHSVDEDCLIDSLDSIFLCSTTTQ